MSLIRRLGADERGTTLVILVLVLVVLLGFAAFAVDAAGAWSLRRQDQAAADTGAVAGALFTAGKSKAAAIADATAEIVRITYDTISPDMSPEEWEAEWSACVDESKPSEFTVVGTSDCVSFTDNLARLRVRTPTVPWMNTFGQVIGYDRINTHAEAEVNTALAGSGGVLPFGMPGQSSDMTEICLKTGSNPKDESPCDGPETGNFGFLDFTQFGNDDLGTATDCTPDNSILKYAIAQGVDHPLGVAPSSSPAPHDDRTACTDGNFNSRPYQVYTSTGNVAQVLDDGFAGDGSGLAGKLGRGDNLVSVRGKLLDNTPLWDYLTADGRTYCANAVGSISIHDDMAACLDKYVATNSSQVLFSADIAAAPRWGWVPLFYGTTLGNGTTSLTIKEFRPVYVQTVFMGCNASSCDVAWDPGEASAGPGKTNIRIEAATAVQIPRSALPEEIRSVAPGSATQVDYLLSK
jgi:Flp pilus assembly protein TadG